MIRISLITIFLILTTLVFFSCKKKVEKEPTPKISEVAFIDKELEFWKEELSKLPYFIDTKNIKDPFVGPIVGKTVSYSEIINLKLVGIVEKNGIKMALLQDENKMGYFVKKGARVGNYKVLEIGKNQVILEEEITDIYGHKRKVKHVLTLPKEMGIKEELKEGSKKDTKKEE